MFPDAYIEKVTNDFDLTQSIGKGGCGEVFKARFDEGTLVAVKKLSADTLNTVKNLKNEIDHLTL